MLMKKHKKNMDGNFHAHDFMPNKKYFPLLRERADQLAKKNETESKNIEYVNYIKFRLGKSEYYGIPYSKTKEVINHFSISLLPCSMDYIAGIINWRGSLITVINLKKFLKIPINEGVGDHCVIIIQSKTGFIGMLVDDIEGSDSYNPISLHHPFLWEGKNNNTFILGLARGKIAIVDTDLIIDVIEKQLK